MLLSVGEKRPSQLLIPTHGLTAEKIVERIRRVESRHAEKEAKLDECQRAVKREFSVNQERFRITDAILRDRGEDVEVFLQIARRTGAAWRQEIRLSKVVPLAAVPDAAGIEAMARDAVEAAVASEIEQDEIGAEVRRMLAGGGV